MTLLHPSVQVQELYPIGTIIEATCPPNNNWLKCEGQLLSRSTYSELLAVLETDNPYSWQKQETIKPLDSAFDSSGLLSVIKGGSRWVAVGWGGDFAYSDDGVTWTSGTLPDTSKDYLEVAYNGSVWCTAGYNSISGATSTTGASWTSRTLPAIEDWEGICWDGTYFILAANDTTNCYTSTDGITWNNVGTYPVGPNFIASDGSGLTVAVRSSGQIMVSSDGGVNWTLANNSPYIPFGLISQWKISYANGYFILPCQYNSGHTWISTDGYEWKQIWFDTMENIGHTAYSSYDPRNNNPSGIKWRYFKDQWFGLPDGHDLGVRSPDMKRFYPWPINMGNLASTNDFLYNSSSGKIIIIEDWYRYMTVCEEYGFDEVNYFQLPRKSFNQFGVNNIYYFIRAI